MVVKCTLTRHSYEPCFWSNSRVGVWFRSCCEFSPRALRLNNQHNDRRPDLSHISHFVCHSVAPQLIHCPGLIIFCLSSIAHFVVSGQLLPNSPKGWSLCGISLRRSKRGRKCARGERKKKAATVDPTLEFIWSTASLLFSLECCKTNIWWNSTVGLLVKTFVDMVKNTQITDMKGENRLRCRGKMSK